MVQAQTQPDAQHINLFGPLLPVYFIDYLWVISLYMSVAFWLAAFIDGIVLRKFNVEEAKKKRTVVLYFETLTQIAIQGIVAILVINLLQFVPSPANGLLGYDHHSPTGTLLRNPAIITSLLLALSKSLQARLNILFARFDKNAHIVVPPY